MPRLNVAKFGVSKRQRTGGERGIATQLREMWFDMPASTIPRLSPPRMISEEDARENYAFRGTGVQDPVALVFRVCDGVKPMATILMRCPKRQHVSENSVIVATQMVGLGCQVFFGRTGRREAVIYQPQATLSSFYDAEAVVARYAQAGIAIPRDIFETPLFRFGRGMVNEQFPEGVRLPLIGLCFGYPISETIDMIKVLQASEASSAQGGQDVLLRHAEQPVERVGRDGVGV